jgi:acylphosphatase
MKATAHVLVEGEVQGVGYRATAWNVAKKLGVAGWVRNLADGRVEAVVEGEKEVVERMIGWFNKGPPGAYVQKVKVEWVPYKAEFKTFEIRGRHFY